MVVVLFVVKAMFRFWERLLVGFAVEDVATVMWVRYDRRSRDLSWYMIVDGAENR